MNRTIYATTAAAIACSAIGLAAQTSRDPSSQATPVARITVIGCVEPVAESAATTGDAKDSKYKLSHAKSGKSDSSQATGTTGGASQAPTATTYRLDNTKNSTLAEDVGDQVEIVAVIEPDTAAPTGTTGSTRAAATEPRLKVETIRVISTTCPQ
jgi:hypothetical protein